MNTIVLIGACLGVSFIVAGVVAYRLGYSHALDEAEKNIGLMVEEHLEQMRILRAKPDDGR